MAAQNRSHDERLLPRDLSHLDVDLDRRRINARIARLIHESRTAAGLTQAQLAERVGTRQQVIARLEDADLLLAGGAQEVRVVVWARVLLGRDPV